jgi:hypothetical protein
MTRTSPPKRAKSKELLSKPLTSKKDLAKGRELLTKPLSSQKGPRADNSYYFRIAD